MTSFSTAFSGTGHQTTLVGGHGSGFVHTVNRNRGDVSASTTNLKGDTVATFQANRSQGHSDAAIAGPLGGTATSQATWSLGQIDASITGPPRHTSTFEYNRSNGP